MTYRKLPYIRL